MTKGIIYIISAPSGTGKSSLIQALLKEKPLYDVQISISHTTRKSRAGEKHGQHYFFISKDVFHQMTEQGEFIEYAEVFGNYYGTTHASLNEILLNGMDVFLDIDWQGAKQIRDKMPQARSIFILPPSREILARRLRTRRKDSEDVISKRMASSVTDMMHYSDYDYLIINDNFSLALSDLQTIVCAERLRLSRQLSSHGTLIRKLLED